MSIPGFTAEAGVYRSSTHFMSIPGFTAKASVYWFSTHIQLAGSPAEGISRERVVLQQGPDCYWWGATYYCCDPPGSQNCTAVAVIV